MENITLKLEEDINKAISEALDGYEEKDIPYIKYESEILTVLSLKLSQILISAAHGDKEGTQMMVDQAHTILKQMTTDILNEKE